jgi:hypothetical protein
LTTFDRDRLIEAMGITAMWGVSVAYAGTASRPHGNPLIGLALVFLVGCVWFFASDLALYHRLPSLRRGSFAPPQDWRARGIGFVAGLVSVILIGLGLGFESWLVWWGGLYFAYIVELIVRRPMTEAVSTDR